MKLKVWLMVLMLTGVLAVALGTNPVFAEGPTTPPDSTTWNQMYQACQTGDYATMQKLHSEYCGGQNGTAGGMMGGQGGMMNGGMMGGGHGMMGNW